MKTTCTLPACCPHLFYDDAPRAIGFLEKAFGFEKRFAQADPDGTICHAQLGLGDAVIMLGSTSKGFIVPAKSPEKAGVVTSAIYVFVADVDAHHARARKAGATIKMEPEDMFWGDRIYCATDTEGHLWTFAVRK